MNAINVAQNRTTIQDIALLHNYYTVLRSIIIYLRCPITTTKKSHSRMISVEMPFGIPPVTSFGLYLKDIIEPGLHVFDSNRIERIFTLFPANIKSLLGASAAAATDVAEAADRS